MAKTEPTEQRDLITDVLAQMNRKIRLIEERIDNVRSHLELLESNMLEMNKSITAELEAFNKTAHELRSQMQDNVEKFDQLAEKINNLASRDSVRVIEKYMELINPLTLVNREEVDEIVDERMKKK